MNHIIRKAFLVSSIILGVCAVVSCAIPQATLASHASRTQAKAVLFSGAIQTSLVATNTPQVLSGTASGTKIVQVYLYKKGDSKVFLKSTKVRVEDGVWNVKISKNISIGSYDVRVYGVKNGRRKMLVRETSYITDRPIVLSTAVMSIQSIPLLLGGQARAGTSIPVSYLQVTNGNQSTTSLKGFWIKQNGTALKESVIGFTSIDDTGAFQGFIGGVEGFEVFKGGIAYVPISEVVFSPGQVRLFTIKAVLSRNVAAHIGTQLVLDVTSVDTSATIVSALPVRGVVWTITY